MAKLSIMDQIVASKRAAQGASSNKLSVDDVNYKNREPGGPGASGTHKTINDLWKNRWVSAGDKRSINDGMYTWYSYVGAAGPDNRHLSVSDNLAQFFHAAGNP